MTLPDQRPGTRPTDLLWIFAHPDDEAFSAAGTMAWAAESGLRTAYICATRGEAGGIRDSALATPVSLGAVREHELRAAMAHVGLSDLRLLGFRDSGMENTPPNDDPRALIQQPAEALLTLLVGHIRDLRPASVVTFGPEGIYGHPDHVRIGEIAVRAVELAADAAWMPALLAPWQVSSLYFSVAPRSMMERLADHPDQPLGEISDASRQNLGTPDHEITHWLDVSRWLDAKRRVLAAHATQIDPNEVLSPAPEAAVFDGLEIEPLQRRPLPWDPDMTAHDPITRAHTELGTSAPALDAAVPGAQAPR